MTGGGAPLGHAENSTAPCPVSGIQDRAGLSERREGHDLSRGAQGEEREAGIRASTDGTYGSSGGGLIGGNGRGGAWGCP